MSLSTKQVHALKLKYPEAIILFRVGDFYKTFNEDALITAKILDLDLIKNDKLNMDMAGFPANELDNYLPKLVRAGNRVAICDQLSA